MSCFICGTGSRVWGRCRCCELIDKDTTKKWVKYCRLCGVNLCEPCRNSPAKRILAFGKQFFE